MTAAIELLHRLIVGSTGYKIVLLVFGLGPMFFLLGVMGSELLVNPQRRVREILDPVDPHDLFIRRLRRSSQWLVIGLSVLLALGFLPVAVTCVWASLAGWRGALGFGKGTNVAVLAVVGTPLYVLCLISTCRCVF